MGKKKSPAPFLFVLVREVRGKILRILLFRLGGAMRELVLLLRFWELPELFQVPE